MVTTTCPVCKNEVVLEKDDVRGEVYPAHFQDPTDERSRYCPMSNQEIGYD